MRRFGLWTIASAALACALAIDGILLYGREQLWKEAVGLPESQIWFPRGSAVPSGYLSDGFTYGPALTEARCFAILFTSSSCGLCSAEMPEWRALVERSQNLGCDALRIPPNRNAASPRYTEISEGRQVVFLDPEWLSGSPPSATPTLIIFARGAATAWCRVGELDPKSTRAAFTALAAAAMVGGGNRPPAAADEAPGQNSASDDARLICR